MKTILKVLSTIVAVPFGIIGALLLLPFVAVGLIISLPAIIICDIWDIEAFPDETCAPYKIDNQE